MLKTCLEHGENMLCTEIVFEIQNDFCTQHFLPMLYKNKSFWQRFTCTDMKKRRFQLQKQFHTIFIHSVWQIMYWKIAIGPFFLSRLTLTSIRVSRIYIEINHSFFHEGVHNYSSFLTLLEQAQFSCEVLVL